MKKFKNIAVCFVVTFLLPAAAFAKTGDWGLGYPTPGAQPTGNESRELLQKYDAYYVGSPDEKIIYLTFDAGFENGHTEKILDVLKKRQIPAAFFLVGTYIRDNPELVKRMVDEGHIVANHTMRHPDMPDISGKEEFMKELKGAEEAYKTATGLEMPKFYRPPKGKYSESNMEMAKEAGYKTIFWSLAYRDWEVDNQPTKDEAFSKLIPRIHPGAVILLHNTSKSNADILDELILKYKELGFGFKSLNHLAPDAPGPLLS